ncbi:MAG: DUF2637 domain-containing protein [Pseudonocardiaceae bacterium]
MTTPSAVLPGPSLASGGRAVPLSPAVRVITVLAVVVVAVIAAVVSYSHLRQLADQAGEAWRAYLIPLSIDGLIVAASMVLLTRRRTGLRGGPLAWSALGGGVLASLAANMADARPGVTAVLVAGWPAVAFAVAFELLLQQHRAEATASQLSPEPGTTPVTESPPTPLPPLPDTPAAPVSGTPGQTQNPAPTTTQGHKPVPQPSRVPKAATVTPEGDDLVTQIRMLLAGSAGKPPGRRAIARLLNITEHQARAALHSVGASTATAPDTSGGGEP